MKFMKHTITIVNDNIYFLLKSKKTELEKRLKKILTWDEFFKLIIAKKV